MQNVINNTGVRIRMHGPGLISLDPRLVRCENEVNYRECSRRGKTLTTKLPIYKDIVRQMHDFG